jgi:DNA repair protein RecO (recombination protein O)
MNQIITTAIVLSRTNYQEADRILTLLTPDKGKVHVLAKGVRKSRSKMAAGTELLSISEIGYIRGRGELATLTSARLRTHYGTIVKDLERTNYAYDVIKRVNRITEDNAEPAYFELLRDVLERLNEPAFNLDLLQAWTNMQLLRVTGHEPDLARDKQGRRLEGDSYNFDFDTMTFFTHPDGTFTPAHIKLLRLCQTQPAAKLAAINGIEGVVTACAHLTRTILPFNGLA